MDTKKTSMMFFVAFLSIFLISTSVYGAGIFDQFQSLFQSDTQETTFFQGTQERCRDIYAYWPAGRCCAQDKPPERGDITVEGTIPPNDYWKCPKNAIRCEVTITSLTATVGTPEFYKAYDQNCEKVDTCGLPFSCPRWECDGETQYRTAGTDITLEPGQVFYGWHSYWGGSGEAEYKVYKRKLCECMPDRTCHVPCTKVPGSTQCAFVTNKDVYDESGQIEKGEEVEEGISYTVPYGDCYIYYPTVNRHSIGDTCEECEDNSDCVQLYRNSYTYNGETYGAVCNGGTLQLFGCMPSDKETCIKWKDADQDNQTDYGEGCMEYGHKKRCQMVLSLTEGMCCPGESSCGSQSFCDPETYTCSGEVECEDVTDCARKVQCDYTSKTLKTPICNEKNKCDWETEDVECCNDGNCQSGWYCSANHKCLEEPDVKKECPFMCCENTSRYFEKPCPSGQTCCADNFCRDECDPNPGVCNYNDECEPDRGETKANCVDCEEGPGPTVCKKDCMPWDIGCKLEVMWCKFVKKVQGTFMWIGVGVVGLLILFIIWKVLSARVPRMPGPRRTGRAVVPRGVYRRYDRWRRRR